MIFVTSNCTIKAHAQLATRSFQIIHEMRNHKYLKQTLALNMVTATCARSVKITGLNYQPPVVGLQQCTKYQCNTNYQNVLNAVKVTRDSSLKIKIKSLPAASPVLQCHVCTVFTKLLKEF